MTSLTLLVLLLASAPDGKLVGWIADSTGTSLPGVPVSVSREEGGPSLVAVSDSNGFVRLVALEAGNYRVVASLQGFKTEQSTVLVRSGRTTAVAFALELADPLQDVVVCCCLPLIEPKRVYATPRRPDDSALAPQVRHFRLTITDSAGRPLPGAFVAVTGAKAVSLLSRQGGSVEFSGLEEDFVSVVVTHEGFRSFSTLLCCLGGKGRVTLRTQAEVDAEKP